MKILRFQITNFKGIKNTELGLTEGAPGRVVTLIGLNESGKTTILEALSNFVSSDSQTQTLVETVYSKVDPKTFIPKDRKGRFTDKIAISSVIELDEEDIAAVRRELLIKHNVHLVPGSMSDHIKAEKAFKYKDSLLDVQNKLWTIKYKFTKGNASKVHQFNAGTADIIWHAIVRVLNSRLPSIVYFPTFLFDVPDRIYLTEVSNETIRNSYYRKVFSDVLKAVDAKYLLQVHILDRVSALIKSDGVAAVGNSEKSDDIDTVIRDVSNEISRVIMGAWKDILEKEVVSRIELRWGVDQELDNAVYVEPYVVERQQYKYLLKERSLGFRWFFSFLLFTQFRRQNNENGTIFLFDEPASHLHSAAQTELLKSFTKIMGDRDYIIYSTHSHYMINPIWLEKAYIINNNAVDIEHGDLGPYTATPNDVVAIKYKRFVSDNPTRLTYFQPVLDALRFKSSPMTMVGPAVIVEGKFDYYPFVYMQQRLYPESDIGCFAAQGAGEMAVLISLFRGWNVPFVILLDADKQGKIEYNRYMRDYHVSEHEMFTLDQANSSLDHGSFEKIFQQDVIDLISVKDLSTGGKLKAEGSALFQLLLATGDNTADIPDTLKMFEDVHAKVVAALEVQAAQP